MFCSFAKSLTPRFLKDACPLAVLWSRGLPALFCSKGACVRFGDIWWSWGVRQCGDGRGTGASPSQAPQTHYANESLGSRTVFGMLRNSHVTFDLFEKRRCSVTVPLREPADDADMGHPVPIPVSAALVASLTAWVLRSALPPRSAPAIAPFSWPDPRKENPKQRAL